MGRLDPLPRETLVGIQVLVVDDVREACDLLSTLLGYCGALVTTATSADSALAGIARVVPDLIVCDIAMTEHDGYWFLAALRRMPLGAAIPVIAMTAYADVHTAEHTLAAGFNGHVRKPIDPWELARLIGSLARARS